MSDDVDRANVTVDLVDVYKERIHDDVRQEEKTYATRPKML